MKLGAFSISLGVKDLQASKAFYTKLGFSQFGGTDEHHYAIMKNGDTLVASPFGRTRKAICGVSM